MPLNPEKYVYVRVGLVRGSWAHQQFTEDAETHHMEDQPGKLVALRLTEYYEMKQQLKTAGTIVAGGTIATGSQAAAAAEPAATPTPAATTTRRKAAVIEREEEEPEEDEPSSEDEEFQDDFDSQWDM